MARLDEPGSSAQYGQETGGPVNAGWAPKAQAEREQQWANGLQGMESGPGASAGNTSAALMARHFGCRAL